MKHRSGKAALPLPRQSLDLAPWQHNRSLQLVYKFSLQSTMHTDAEVPEHAVLASYTSP